MLINIVCKNTIRRYYMKTEPLPDYYKDYDDTKLLLGSISLLKEGKRMVGGALTKGREADGHLSYYDLGEPVSSIEITGGLIEYQTMLPDGKYTVVVQQGATSFGIVRKIKKL